MLEGKIFGIPLILIVLVWAIFLPIFVIQSLYFAATTKQNKVLENEIINTRIVVITPNPTATPSATIEPTQSVKRVFFKLPSPTGVK